MIPFVRIFEYGNTKVRPKIKTIINSSSAYFVLLDNGQLWGGGEQKYGQLGLGDTLPRYQEMIKLRDDVRLVDCISDACLIVTFDNKVMYSGRNIVLGTNDTTINPVFTDITNERFVGVDISTITKITCSITISVLTSSGDVYGTGHNALGTVGNGTVERYNASTPYLTASGIKDIFVDASHVYLLKNNGEIWGVGNNGYGAVYSLDDPRTSTQTSRAISTPVQLFKTFSVLNTETDVFFGTQHNAYIMRGDGSLISNACGSKFYGDIGLGIDTSGPKGVFSTEGNGVIPSNPKIGINYITDSCKLYVSNDNKLYSIGYNNNGNLSNGNTTTSAVWLDVTDSYPGDLSLVRGVSCYASTVVIWDDYDVYTCGSNLSLMTKLFGTTGKTLLLSKINDLPWI